MATEVETDIQAQRAIRAAMYAAAAVLAAEIEQPIEVAIRQPVSMASVFNDLSTMLRMDTPALVRAALGEVN